MPQEPIARRVLQGGRIVHVVPLTFGRARLCVVAKNVAEDQVPQMGYVDAFDFASTADALEAMDKLKPNEEPNGWIRHPASGRRRPEGDASKEFISP